jgi:nucleoside-diphosphate-sugar epimerase
MNNQVILFGQSGQIGSALAELFKRCKIPFKGIPWRSVIPLLGKNEPDLAKILPDFSDQGRYTYICANGLTDSMENFEELKLSNFVFPLALWSHIKSLKNSRMLTIGTVHEKFPNLCAQNNYLLSKSLLSEWIQKEPHENRILHLRLHTLYGRKLKSHMFLGQIAKCLSDKKVFSMTSGEQLREYHHVDDIALGICKLIETEWNFGPILEMNSGNGIRLVDLAQAIFSDWKRTDLLSVGAHAQPLHENTDFQFETSPKWVLPESRDPIEGVVEFIRDQLS